MLRRRQRRARASMVSQQQIGQPQHYQRTGWLGGCSSGAPQPPYGPGMGQQNMTGAPPNHVAEGSNPPPPYVSNGNPVNNTVSYVSHARSQLALSLSFSRSMPLR